MTKALLLLLSTALIAAGVGLVWRDVHRKRREAFLVRGDATFAHPEVEVVVSRPEPEFTLPRIAQSSPQSSPHGSSQPGGSGSTPEPSALWAALQPVLASAVERVNGVLAGAGVTIGASGEPSWSLMTRGYGGSRRILISGESVAWLRLELDGNGQLQANVKAHKDDLAAINAGASVAGAGLDVARASDLLSACLKPAASFAVRGASGANPEQWASEAAWKEIDPLVAAALRAANGALQQAGARFLPLGAAAWTEDVRRHRLTVNVEVMGADAARMLIERVGDEIEVAVGVPDARLSDHLGRRQRLPLPGVSTHALAELIASSTWPAIAHFREH
jgi:hypothetical protein